MLCLLQMQVPVPPHQKDAGDEYPRGVDREACGIRARRKYDDAESSPTNADAKPINVLSTMGV